MSIGRLSSYSLYLFVLLSHLSRASGSAYLDTDVYTSPYPQIPNDPPGGFKLWSSSSTWPNGIVPGVGSALYANATIPAGVAVMLDVPNVTLHTLRISGLLKFLDDEDNLPTINVATHYVLVDGQLSIGDPGKQFSQTATIELTPNSENARASLTFTSPSPADGANPRSIGHKAFAVVGGQVHLHGIPGPATMPVWTRLSKTAQVGDTDIVVGDPGAGKWPLGGVIAISSTDYDYKQAEEFTIVSILACPWSVKFTLDRPLKYMHWGGNQTLSDGFGGFIDESAEVALLSRNIVIKGTEESGANSLQGGHFIIYQTPVAQYVEGVEFTGMGQQGIMGRYPLHLYLCGTMSTNTVIRKNSIHKSFQRCIVAHATHGVTFDNNVAYNTAGHCFVTEEGGEINNVFSNNLGMLTIPVVNPIMVAGSPSVTRETDATPATFWNSNQQNSWINNVAAGSANAGFWIELRTAVRGNSLNIPSIAGTIPLYSIMATCSGNTAHSNAVVGFTNYPYGSTPHIMTPKITVVTGVITRATIYKNAFRGMELHNANYINVTESAFADNGQALTMGGNLAVYVSTSRFVALTENYGNPVDCSKSGTAVLCQPVTGCTLPLAPGVQGRSVGAGLSNNGPTFGVLLYSTLHQDPGNFPEAIRFTTFYNYKSSCHLSAAILMYGFPVLSTPESWNPSQSIEGLQFANSLPIYASKPTDYTSQYIGQSDSGGEQAHFYSLHDVDGSIVGGHGGYVIVNDPFTLPPKAAGCSAIQGANGYACPGLCFRAVQVKFWEAGYGAGCAAANGRVPPGTYSSLTITRLADGQSLTLKDINMPDMGAGNYFDFRYFTFTILTGYTYQISVIGGTKNPAFVPSNLTVHIQDGGGCSGGVELQFLLSSYSSALPSWAALPGPGLVTSACPGSSNALASSSIIATTDCVNSIGNVHLSFGYNTNATVMLVPSSASTGCSTTAYCAVVYPSSLDWRFSASGYSTDLSKYTAAAAPFGFTTVGRVFGTYLPRPSATQISYGFYTQFTLSNTSAISSLTIHIIVNDGALLYLNGNLIKSLNMPTPDATHPITKTTLALNAGVFNTFQTLTFALPDPTKVVQLVEGTNTIGVDLHVDNKYQGQLAFDLDIYATYNYASPVPVTAPVSSS
eukprot:TRINITY_DN8652_c0_g1_i1.p1 TRINITY_DN8652_c0_g1~~TRINITY_DN8652_c0_g1_i1.p1  ORF type:complete len:1139 (-),score=148.93 TRINITY_DN8652_c0_g1_i1:828-4244(-)